MVLEGKRGQWGFRRLRRWCYQHLTGALQDFQAVLSLEQAAEMATTRAQEERDVDDRVDREKEEEEEGEEEDEEHVEFGHPSPSDRYNDDGQDEEDEETPQLASRYAGVEVHDTMAVEETTVDRTGPTLAEVQSLGPIEELEAELFDKVEREVPAGSGTTKQVFVCKFCTEEFTYMVRDMHTHKNICAKYPGRESMTRVVRTVPDEENREIVVDMEVEGEPKDANTIVEEDEDEVNGAEALVANDTKDEDDDQQEEAHAADEEDVGMDRDSGNPGDKGEQEEEEDEIQMLEDEPIKVLFPCRVEMPDETDEPRPILKVAKTKLVEVTEPSHDVDMDDAPRESDTTKTDDRGGDDDVVEEHGSPENASETASTGSGYGSGRDAYRTAFHLFTDGTGEHAECLHCGRVCSNRGSAMATHYKSCAARSHANAAQHRSTIHQLITPKKKTTKRRISGQEFELLEEETTSQANESDDDSQPGSPPLRRSKRFKAESKGDGKVSNPTTEIEPLSLMGDTTSTAAATEATTTIKRPKPTKPNDTNDLDGYPLSEFDLVAHDKRLQCQHCHSEMVFREYIAEKHLRECENYKANRTPSTTIPAPLSKSQKRGKTTDRDGASVSIAVATLLRHPERLRAADILGFNHDAALQWIFGSCPIDRMRSHYGKSPMVVRSPVARFRAVEAEFADLHVAKLLAQLPLTTTITAMVPRPTRDGQEYATASLTSASAALTMYESNCPLVVRAPAIVAHMFVPHFAKALGCGSMVATDQHDVMLLCAQGPLRLDWQYHKNDSFVVCLRGKAVWKMRASVVTAPPDSFHLSSTNPANRERVVAMQVASLGVGSGRTTVPVPTGTTFDFATDSDGEEDRAESTSLDARHDAPLTDQQMVADAGAVVYIPAGTWYCVGGLEGASALLQFQMKTVKVKEILSDLVQQLVVTQPKYREAIKDAVDGDAAVPQQFVLARLRDLATQLTVLSSNEILPELLVTTDTKPASVIYEGGDDRATRVYRFDLRDPNNFQGGQQVHFYKRSTFRVTPLAVLMRLDELPPPLKRVETMMSNLTPPTAAATLSSTLTSTKKALHRKTKRALGVASSEATQRPHTLSSLDTANSSKGSAPPPGMYNLLLGLGGAGKPPRLKVQFWCNAAQQAIIEWIRTRDTPEPFCVSELAKVLAHHQGGHADFELLKMTLRFLCAMGYLINVDVPL